MITDIVITIDAFLIHDLSPGVYSKSNTTGATSGAGAAYPSGTPAPFIVKNRIHVNQLNTNDLKKTKGVSRFHK